MLDSCILFVGLIIFSTTVTYDLNTKISTIDKQKTTVEEQYKK